MFGDKVTSLVLDWLQIDSAEPVASSVDGESHDHGGLASKAQTVKAKRHVATLIRKNLEARGTFYRTERPAALYFFNKQERELYALRSLQFRALCAELYGINGKESVWSYIEETVQTHCLRHGVRTELFQFARYHDQKLYVHAGGQRVFRLDGVNIDTIDNGDDSILFECDQSLEPIHPDYEFTGSPVRDHLVNVANAINPDRLALYEIDIYTKFFESLLPTKPIVLFTGPKGSGKTSAARALKRALHGPTANVDTGMASREDAFWAAICHNHLVCIDNVDALVPWLADALAGLLVTLRHSKTDQERVGRKVPIPYARGGICPVGSLKAWLDHAGITGGAVFRAVTRSGRVLPGRLSAQSVALIVKRRAGKIGLKPDAYSGHSLRAGFATSAAKLRASIHKIAIQTGHRSHAMIMRYVRDADLFDHHPLREML